MEAKERIHRLKRQPHPLENASFFSKLFFCWSLPLFLKGYRKDLNEEDLFLTMRAHESRHLGDQLENAWNCEKSINKDNPSLWKAIVKVFGREFALYGLSLFVLEIFVRMCHPLVLQKVITYYTPGQDSISETEAYVYSFAIMMISLANVLSGHLYVFGLQRLGMKLRIACCSVIYRKSLKLNQSAFGKTSAGQMVNLLSNDVNRFDLTLLSIHNIWVGPLEIAVIIYLLYTNLGVASLSGITILVFFVPLQLYLGRKAGTYRMKTAVKTDNRIRLMNEIISGIQVIKMYTWEKPFTKLVEEARKLELRQIKHASHIRGINISFFSYLNRTSIYLCILTYVFLGNSLNAQYVYVLTSFYGVLQSVILFVPQAASGLAETNVSVKRIKQFLLHKEICDLPSEEILLKPKFKTNSICIENASTRWTKETDYILNNINFKAEPNELVAVIGKVASGKSSLLNVILKELGLEKGSVNSHGSISYTSQQPWLFSGSIRQNILFGNPFEPSKYDEVVKVCALGRDLRILPNGDQTLVGEKGVTLSGGQKARINLARAIYKEADIYLLDDPLSAVDTKVGKQLFEDCILGYLKNKCRVLVTHQLQYLKKTDKIYLLDDGNVVACGGYLDLKDNAYIKFLKVQDHTDEDNVEKKDAENKIDKFKEYDEILEEQKEHRSTGTVSNKVYASFLKAGGSYCTSFLVFILFVLSQLGATGTDYFQTFWVNFEQDQNNSTRRNEPFFSSTNCLYIYTSLLAFTIIITLMRSICFFSFCITASKNLHNNMFSKIVYATMRFFNTNSSGRILNRFSKDIGAIDDLLPTTLSDTIQIALTVLAIMFVSCGTNPWILIPTIIIFALFYVYRTIFVSSSRNLKRIEGTSRSPVFAHLTASLQGLTTIRACGAQNILKQQFDQFQNDHTSSFFTYLGTTRTFGFWLDFHCVLYIGIVTIGFLFVGKEEYGGTVGLAITQCVPLTGMLQWGMRQWSEVENQMTSVERVVEYTVVPSEPIDKKLKNPDKTWPNHGQIWFNSVSLQYSETSPLVLKKVSFKILPKEKIGIVGRTGAGKSSLITALFRLAPFQGEIQIDGTSTKDIPLENLRSKISIIPQDPVLFSGTLRRNLDPFDEFNDTILWDALEDVELKAHITDLSSGLYASVSDGGSNFSVGQRQLLCLARALIRKNKILVLDEATANVDPTTDELIQRAIRRKFADCTVLTIAHRLHTVMDSDKVLVMDQGMVKECDHPFILIQEKGLFYELVNQTGKVMATNLKNLVKKKYEVAS